MTTNRPDHNRPPEKKTADPAKWDSPDRQMEILADYPLDREVVREFLLKRLLEALKPPGLRPVR